MKEDSITKNQAVMIYDSGIWKKWSNEDIVRIQLFQRLLCVPFSRFHEAMEAVLGRPIWTHEFAFVDLLRDEYLGKRHKPTLEEIIELIPEEKRIVLFSD